MVSNPGHDYSEYQNWDFRYKLMLRVKSLVQKILGRNVKAYS